MNSLRVMRVCFLAMIGLLFTQVGFGLSFPMPEGNNDLLGQTQIVHAHKGDHIYNIAERYDMGYYELIEANPKINRHSSIDPKEAIHIPSEYILPNTEREGIVINLPELRLYYYDPSGHVYTYPIAIGKFNWTTPTLTTKIIDKRKDPYWHVPKSIKEAAAAKGIHYPDIVPPGPKNPLGKFAMRLGARSYLIHGTINPRSIGKRASSGCIRLYPNDIEQLFDLVSVDTPVRIVNDFFKLGWRNKTLYIEIHEPLFEHAPSQHEAMEMIHEKIDTLTDSKPTNIHWNAVHHALKEKSGIPTPIGQLIG